MTLIRLHSEYQIIHSTDTRKCSNIPNMHIGIFVVFRHIGHVLVIFYSSNGVMLEKQMQMEFDCVRSRPKPVTQYTMYSKYYMVDPINDCLCRMLLWLFKLGNSFFAGMTSEPISVNIQYTRTSNAMQLMPCNRCSLESRSRHRAVNCVVIYSNIIVHICIRTQTFGWQTILWNVRSQSLRPSKLAA